MAGLGSRFSQEGYLLPKPLLPISGQPMYRVVVKNLMHPSVGSITLIAQRAWQLQSDVSALSVELGVPVGLIEIDYVTQGAADTVQIALERLNLHEPVIVANSDQYIDASLDSFYDKLSDNEFDGVILTMGDSHPKWSYVELDDAGLASHVREKQVISPYATVGIYGFRNAGLMSYAFGRMRDAGDTHNGEFYVAPSYNYLIESGHRIAIDHLGEITEIMHGLGTPTDYELFLQSAAAKKI